MKLGFFNMIQRLANNPCIGRASNSLRRKKCKSKSKFKAMIIFSISGGWSTLIGYLKVRLRIRFIIKMFWRPSVNMCDEGNRTFGRLLHGSFIKTMHQPTAHYLWSVIWKKKKNIPVMEYHHATFLVLKGTRLEAMDVAKGKVMVLRYMICF